MGVQGEPVGGFLGQEGAMRLVWLWVTVEGTLPLEGEKSPVNAKTTQPPSISSRSAAMTAAAAHVKARGQVCRIEIICFGPEGFHSRSAHAGVVAGI